MQKRENSIGGSDCAPALGLSKWKTQYQLWLEKTGQAKEEEQTEVMYWGNALEEPIRQKYIEITGQKVRKPSKLIKNLKYPFMTANVDGIVEGKKKILEVKTSLFSDGWGEPGSDEIPEDYLLQVHHYMIVTGIPIADVAVLIGGGDFRIYTVEKDKHLHECIIDRATEFWQKVTNLEEPELKSKDFLLKFPTSKNVSIECDKSIYHSIQVLKNLSNHKKLIESQEEEMKNEIKRIMQDCDTLTYSNQTLATWRSTKLTTKLDEEKLKKLYPAIYKECQTEESNQRRFLIK